MLWILTVIAGFFGSIYCGLLMLHRFQVAASVTSVDVNWRTFNITFPAITICRDEKVNMTAVKEYARWWVDRNCQLAASFVLSLKNIYSYIYLA